MCKSWPREKSILFFQPNAEVEFDKRLKKMNKNYYAVLQWPGGVGSRFWGL